MKTYLWVILAILVLSCQKEDDSFVPGENTLHHDGPNLSAPVIAQGISYSAVRFSGNEIQNMGHGGKELKAIDFYLDQRPQDLRILVFSWNDQYENEPGNVLYEYDLDASRLDEGSWNLHEMNHPISLPQNGLWIAFEINAGDENLRVIGCDPGPRVSNGDIYGLFGDDNPGWITFYEFSEETVDINWNIRGEVE